MSAAQTPESAARRRFVGGAAAALAGVAIAPGLILLEVRHASATAPEIASGAVRWGLLVDTTLCGADCTACVDACQKENGLAAPTRPTDAQWIRKVELTDPYSGRSKSLPMM
ncbi:MAG TPA: 4Fe-4S ferredoxin, partial [Burkholderiales bacterium]|nr:4Fe-4S ferredoxin [Burkholderiales bacterium]